MSWSPKLCKSGAIVLARGPDFGGRQVLGRFVVLVEGVFVYDVLACVFWVVSDLVLPWEMTWKPNL